MLPVPYRPNQPIPPLIRVDIISTFFSYHYRFICMHIEMHFEKMGHTLNIYMILKT